MAPDDDGSMILDANPYQVSGGTGGDTELRGKHPITDSPMTGTTFRLRGRLDVEAIATTQSSLNEATFSDLGNVAGIRRDWIGAEGNLAIGGRYITEIDLASGNVVIRDLFVGLGDIENGGELRAGHFLEPFSLEIGTLSYVFPFMETSANTIAFGKQQIRFIQTRHSIRIISHC